MSVVTNTIKMYYFYSLLTQVLECTNAFSEAKSKINSENKSNKQLVVVIRYTISIVNKDVKKSFTLDQ